MKALLGPPEGGGSTVVPGAPPAAGAPGGPLPGAPALPEPTPAGVPGSSIAPTHPRASRDPRARRAERTLCSYTHPCAQPAHAGTRRCTETSVGRKTKCSERARKDGVRQVRAEREERAQAEELDGHLAARLGRHGLEARIRLHLARGSVERVREREE